MENCPFQAGVELKAPKGKFRVVAVDTFDNISAIQDDFDTLEKATACAKTEGRGKKMLKMYVYDDQGNLKDEEGSF